MIRKILFVAVLATIAGVVGYAAFENQSSSIPDEAKRTVNPLQPSDAALSAARPIYLDKCAECHGDTGKGDGRQAAQYDPLPSNFTDVKYMKTVTDGELFYRITQGRRPMPSYKNKLTDDQRWQLVLMLRSFAQSAEHGESPAK